MLFRSFTGDTRGHSLGFTDLYPSELLAAGILLALSVAIGVFPRPLLDLIEPAAHALIDLVGR